MESPKLGEINRQFLQGEWPQFIEMVSIKGLRGWNGQTVEFRFPVCAVVGENGSGKSTLLKAAACIYDNDAGSDKRFYPSTFFVHTVWDQIQGVHITYRVKRGDGVELFQITKPTKRWSYPERSPRRNVFLLDIARTLPLDASAGYARIAKLAASEIESAVIEPEFRSWLSYVLGRDYKNARFAISDVDERREIGLLQREWGEISQFHQGAGEDATLDLFRTLQGIPKYSLLIIDEVEASLHPRAQRRLLKFLLWLAKRQRIQIILSTHSRHILEGLPEEARILLLTGPEGLNVVYGASPEFAMSLMDDAQHPDVHVFVEDREAQTLLREILASSLETSKLLSRIEINPVGPVNAVAMLGMLGSQGKLPHKAVAVLDGDSKKPNCLNLPGQVAPERLVFEALQSAGWPDLPERFGIGAGALLTILDDAMRAPDHHDWTNIVGDRVRKGSQSVWEIMATVWCKYCLADTDRSQLADSISEAINRQPRGRHP